MSDEKLLTDLLHWYNLFYESGKEYNQLIADGVDWEHGSRCFDLIQIQSDAAEKIDKLKAKLYERFINEQGSDPIWMDNE